MPSWGNWTAWGTGKNQGEKILFSESLKININSTILRSQLLLNIMLINYFSKKKGFILSLTDPILMPMNAILALSLPRHVVVSLCFRWGFQILRNLGGSKPQARGREAISRIVGLASREDLKSSRGGKPPPPRTLDAHYLGRDWYFLTTIMPQDILL